MNDIVHNPYANLPAALQNRIKSLLGNVANVAANIQARGGNTQPILSIDKVGRWNLGMESTLIGAEDLLMFDPTSLKHGFTSWHENKPTEHLVPSNMAKPDPSTLPTPPGNKPWQESFSIEGRFITGKIKGQPAIYNPSSLGGAQAIKKLIQDLYRQLDIDPLLVVPIVRLDVGSYPNKTYGGITFYPILVPVRWESLEILAPAEEAAAVQPEPAARRTAEAERTMSRGEHPAEALRETEKAAHQGTMSQRVEEDTRHAEQMAAGAAAVQAAAAAPAGKRTRRSVA